MRLSDVSSAVLSWLDRDVEDLQYELPCGKMAEGLLVRDDAVIFTASEEFGSGMEPYDERDLDVHLEYLESPDYQHGEGTVVYYEGTDDEKRLPKQLFFEAREPFSEVIGYGTPQQLAEELQEELRRITGTDVTVEARGAAGG